MRSRAQTIRAFAHEYFLRVNYVDVYGRNIGYDYEFILAEIKRAFPTARTSKIWLRRMAYELNGSTRMPVRRRSRKALAEGFAMSLLVKQSRLSLNGIRVDVKRKFPDQTVTLAEIKKLERHLVSTNFIVPSRNA